MTYAAKDVSVHDGAPIECYRFVGSSGTFRYTSYHSEITVGGELYTPLPITRTSIETGSIIDTAMTMDFNVPCDCELARRYAFTVSPKELSVTVRRVHEGDDYATDFKVEWVGIGDDFVTNGKWTTIRTGSIFQTKLNGNMSSVYYQSSCNHILFDERCKMVKADWTTTTTVTKVQGQIVTVLSDGVADGELIGGEIKNTRTGEVQSLISNTGSVLRIGYRFIDLIVGDTVELTQGCDHARLGHCKNRFNNVDNYGGFDFIPANNPFDSLNRQTTVDVVTTVKRERVEKISVPTVSLRYV